jgi:hypothetical protein
VSIVRHHQFLDSADLPVDELAQLGGAVILGRGHSAAEKGDGQGAGHLLQEPMAIDRLRRRSVS